MTYLERIAKAKQRYTHCTVVPQPIPIQEPDNYQILNLKLIQPARCTYYIPIGKNTTHKVTHFIQLSECGAPMQTVRHKVEFYETPPHSKIVNHILATPPLITGYTRPFLFHSTQQAHDEIRHFLNTQI